MVDYAGASTITLAGATNTAVLPPRMGRRIAFSVANVGANAAYVNMSDGQAAVANYGVYLAPGGILTDSNSGNYLAWQGSIVAISTAGSTLAIWERVELG